jgi:diguanylate cyclase (GGDEF)-like protein/PAS domain S-box-containing protein
VFEAILNALSDVVVVVDTSGNVRYVNAVAEQLLGLRAEDWIGRPPFELFHPDDVGPMAEALLICRTSPGVREPMLVRVRGAAGDWLTFEIIGNSLFGDDELDGIVIVARDVSSRAAQQVSLGRERRRFELMFEHAPIGIALSDESGAFQRVNGALCTMLGVEQHELVGKSLLDVTATEEPGALDLRLVRRGGEHVDVCVTTATLTNDDGTESIMTLIENVSELRAAERATAREQHLFEAVLANLSDLVAVLNGDGQLQYISPAIERLLGRGAAERVGSSIFENVHPDDLGRIMEQFAVALHQPGCAPPFEARVLHDDGTYRAFEVAANNQLHDPDIEGIILAARDVTVRTELADSLLQAEQRFERVFEHASIGLTIVTTDGRFSRVNPAYARMLGHPQTAFTTMTIASVTHPDEMEATEVEFGRLLGGETESYQLDKRLRRADGTWLWVRLSSSPIRDEHGQIVQLLGQAVDISDARARAERLEHDATHDELTGLASRNLLADSLNRALARAERDGDPVGVLVVDLDYFKRVNDTRGHAAGDDVLIAVAERLRDSVRASDLVARIGGDEFVIMLQSVNGLWEATDVAERVVVSIAEPFIVDGEAVTIGASVGTTVSRPGERDGAVVMARADQAAYAAKAAGRSTNRTAA